MSTTFKNNAHMMLITAYNIVINDTKPDPWEAGGTGAL